MKNVKVLTLLLSFGAVSAWQPAMSEKVEYTKPIRGVSLLKPDYPPPPSGAVPYCHTDAGPLTWSVAQWSTPGGALPPFKTFTTGDTTIFETIGNCSRVKVEVKADSSRVVLDQDGHLLPCNTVKGSPREWDLFLQPNGPSAKAPRECGLPLLSSSNPKLIDLRSLKFEAYVTQWSGVAKTRKHCKCNYANTNFSLIVTNSTHAGETIFYQYVMSHLCGEKSDINLTPCSVQKKKLEVYSSVNPFGVNDYPSLHGQDWLVPGKRTHVKVDLLPNLKKAIAEGASQLDKDLSHWSIRTIYCGQSIYGDTTIKTVWEDVSLVGDKR